MKQLTCEMCGSTDLLKQDGVFVCQSCGCKYSVEEAKKMMIEGVVEVAGTVKVDNSEQVTNFLIMANNAYTAGNNKEAEDYCNKIIEIDPKNAEAWLLKGIAAAWQSTIANPRTDEFSKCYEKVLKNADNYDDMERLAIKGYKEYYKLSLAMHKSKLNQIVKYPNSKSNQEFLRYNLQNILWGSKLDMIYFQAVKTLNEGKPENEKIPKKDLSEISDCKGLYVLKDEESVTSGITLWNNAFKEYKSSNGGYPSDYVTNKMIERGSVAIQIIESVIPSDTSEINNITDERKIKCITRACENLIKMKSDFKNVKSYTISYNNGIKRYVTDKEFNLGYKQTLQQSIEKYKSILNIFQKMQESKERKQQQERIKKYWEEHKEEKQALENELNNLTEKLNDLQSRVDAINDKNAPQIAELEAKKTQQIPEEVELDKQRKLIQDLDNQRYSLGIFHGRQKKELTARLEKERSKLDSMLKTVEETKKIYIDQINNQLLSIKDEGSELRAEIARLSQRQSQIRVELTKNR